MCRTIIRSKCWSPDWKSRPIYDPVNFTYPGGCHIAEVEIDPETGIVTLEKYTAVDDVGTVINPMIVEGQLHGGIVQGVGQALYENAVYDDVSGQLLSGSFMDYTMPRADHLPNMTIDDPFHALHAHTDGRERLRRGRHHRLACGRHQLRGRCVVASRRASRRHAGDAEPDLARHSERHDAARRRVGGGEDEIICISQADYAL